MFILLIKPESSDLPVLFFPIYEHLPENSVLGKIDDIVK